MPTNATSAVTKEEYFHLAEEGQFKGRRVELIGGEVVEMSPVNLPHAMGLTAVVHALEFAFGPGYWAKSQSTLDLSPNGVPDPDVVVLPGTFRSYAGQSIPTTALLVVEVADSSLRDDQTTKMSLYAASGIADYWILNVPNQQLEVYRDPVADASQPFGFRYDQVTVLHAGDFVSPLALPAATIPVADLIV